MTNPDVPTEGPLPDRVLVTGADGMIGSALTASLAQRGVAVTALGLNFRGPSPAQRVITADAADEAAVRDALTGVDAVVHLAAIAHPSMAPAREVFVRNTAATFTVLDQAGSTGVRRAVVAGSINAFGVPMNRHPLAPAYYPLDEQSPVAHDDAYSLSKWTGEHIASWAHSRWGIDVITLRFPLVKPRQTLLDMNSALLGNETELRRLSREGWSYLVLEDAIDAIERALVVPVDGAHTVLVAAETTRLPYDTSELLDRYAPEVERRREFTGREGLVDTSAARRLLGWRPTRSLDPASELHVAGVAPLPPTDELSGAGS